LRHVFNHLGSQAAQPVVNHLFDLGQSGLGMRFAPPRYLTEGFFTTGLPQLTHLFGLHGSLLLPLGFSLVFPSSYHLSRSRKKMNHTLTHDTVRKVS